MGKFPEDVFFVAEDLRPLWPELRFPDAGMEITQVAPARLHTNESIWVVSTYLRLKAHGLNVKIVDRLVPDAINICTGEGVIYAPNSHRAFVVPVQADRASLGWGDYTLVQSPVHAARPQTCLIDCWPQPGLLARDSARSDDIRRVGYLGYSENLAASFRGEPFRTGLASLGVDWTIRERPAEWHNYSDLDLCLAVRGTSEVWIRTKPATKLFHAWITGCPALLGREPAYRYWGEPGVDYLEVNNPAEAVEAVGVLQRDPALYRSMRERGHAKAAAHDEHAVLQQWVAVISGPVWEAFTRWRTDRPSTILVRAGTRRIERVTAPIRRHFFFLRAGGVSGLRRRLRKLWRVVRSRSRSEAASTRQRVYTIPGLDTIGQALFKATEKKMLSQVGTRVMHQIQAVRSVGILGAFKLRTYPLGTRFFPSLPPLTMTSRYAKYPLTCRPHTSDHSAFCQIFVYREYSCVDDLPNVDLVVDCGANVGFASAYFLSRFPRCFVIAVEPEPSNFDHLKSNLAPYGERVHSINSGIWSHPVGLKISEERYRDGREWTRQVRETRPGEVPDMEAVDIATLLKRSGRKRISLLKVDIEGAEAKLFSSNHESWLPYVDTLAIELHDDTSFGKVSDTFLKLIAQMNFKVARSGELTVCRSSAP